MSSTNQSEFGSKLAEWAHKLKIRGATLQKKITFDMHSDIMQRTPVDTGRARANWFVSVGEPSKEISEHTEVKSNFETVKGKRTKVRSVEIPQPPQPQLEIDGTKDTYIINNLPYIKALEEGHSKQAPNGMRKLAMEKALTDVEKAVRDA